MSFEDILAVLEKMHIPTVGLTTNSRLGANIGMDSQEVVEFLVCLEERYGISISPRASSKELSIQEILNMIHQKVVQEVA